MTFARVSRRNVAFVFTSKTSALNSVIDGREREMGEEEDEPPDLLAECDSDETIKAIQDVLEERYRVYPIESGEDAYDELRRLRPDLVFNIAERLFGPSREAQIPTICEILGIPYTGSDPLTLGICLDKSRAKEILTYHGIANPAFWTVDLTDSEALHSVQLPAIVKPMYEGSSKGIRNNSVVTDLHDLHERVHEVLKQYHQPVIVEHFLSGREFTVGILGNYPDLEVLPIVEINHGMLPEGAVPIYSYEAKWVWDTKENPLKIFTCPAEISPDLVEAIKSLVMRTFHVLRIRDWARIDVRLDKQGNPHILEVNPLPGVLPNEEENSCLPKAARAAGYTYSGLIHRVVDEAFSRNGKRYGH